MTRQLSRAFLVILCCAWLRSYSSCAQTCSGFQRGSVGNGFIFSHFSRAVFSVAGVGTAYLIDADNGYLITATHVIADVSSANKHLVITSSTDPTISISAHQINQVDVKDVTLLQLDQPGALKTIDPIDISFSPADYEASLFVMGYPLFGDQANIQLRSGAATLNGTTSNGLLEIAHVTAGGSSGGPLFNTRGEAIGVCHEQIEDDKLGRYVAISDISSLFKSLPVSHRMTVIEGQLASGEMDQKAFTQLLQSPSGPSNLELYVWLQHVASSASLASAMKRYLSCPIEPAIVQRGIPDAILFFVPDLSTQQATEVQVSVAQKDHALGHDQDAYLLLKRSEAGIDAVTNPLLKAEIRLLQGNVAYGLGLNSESTKYLAQAQNEIRTHHPGESYSLPQLNLVGSINSSLGRTSAAIGENAKAASYFNNAALEFSQTGNSTAKASVLLLNSAAYERLGDYPKAIAQAKMATDIATALGDTTLQSHALMTFGELQLKTGDTEKALATFQAANKLKLTNSVTGAFSSSTQDGVARTLSLTGRITF